MKLPLQWCVLILSLGELKPNTGFTGQLSLGHAGFMAIELMFAPS